MIGVSRRRGPARPPRPEQPQPVFPDLLLPSVGAFVDVKHADHVVRCLVEEVGVDALHLALPDGGFLIDDGARVTVEWPNGRGVTAMSAVAETVALRRWIVRAVDDVETVQRRAYVRITAPVRLQVTRSDGTVMHLRTSDLSEGGAGVVFPRVDPPPTAGERVRVSVLCGTQPVRMAAEILRVRDDDEGHNVALRFVGAYAADVLRRWVLERQVAQRRRRRLS